MADSGTEEKKKRLDCKQSAIASAEAMDYKPIPPPAAVSRRLCSRRRIYVKSTLYGYYTAIFY